MSVFKELSRRRVFRVAGLYAIASWLVAEVTATVFPALLLPEWTVTFVVALLVLGFPIAMVLAWAFDIGPAGIERTPAAESVSTKSTRPRTLAYSGLLVGGTLGLMALLYAVGSGSMLSGLRSNPNQDANHFAGPLAESKIRSSIAVLPFKNISAGDSDDYDYFSDGISEELLNLLTKIPRLQVTARTSSFAYKNKDRDVRAIAEELGVEAILEGSVRRSGDRVRITAQLIDAETGYHLWSETYNRDLKDIFKVQDDISAAIVAACKVVLTPGEITQVALQEQRTGDVRAYQFYLQGRHELNRGGEQAVSQSIRLFQNAIDRDPTFARAHSALAAAYIVMPGYTDEPPEQSLERAEEAAYQALAMDDSIGEAHAVLAQISASKWDWTDAESGFFFATSLEANDPTTHHGYSALLRSTGRIEASLTEALKAYELDRDSPIVNGHLAVSYTWANRNELALQHLETATELGLDTETGIVMLSADLREQRYDAAITRLQQTTPDAGFGPAMARSLIKAVETIRHAYDPAMQREVSADIAAESLSDAERLLVYVLTRQTDLAIETAESMIQTRTLQPWMLWLPEADAMRRDPRFSQLVEQLGLVQYWRRYGWADACQSGGEGFTCS